MSAQTEAAVLVLSSSPSRSCAPPYRGGVGRRPFAEEAKAAVDRDVLITGARRIAKSTGGLEPCSLGLAFVNLTVQCASRSFCRSVAGFVFQFSGIRSSLIACFLSC